MVTYIWRWPSYSCDSWRGSARFSPWTPPHFLPTSPPPHWLLITLKRGTPPTPKAHRCRDAPPVLSRIIQYKGWVTLGLEGRCVSEFQISYSWLITWFRCVEPIRTCRGGLELPIPDLYCSVTLKAVLCCTSWQSAVPSIKLHHHRNRVV